MWICHWISLIRRLLGYNNCTYFYLIYLLNINILQNTVIINWNFYMLLYGTLSIKPMHFIYEIMMENTLSHFAWRATATFDALPDWWGNSLGFLPGSRPCLWAWSLDRATGWLKSVFEMHQTKASRYIAFFNLPS